MEPDASDTYAEAVSGASALYDVLTDLEAQSDRFSSAITGALKMQRFPARVWKACWEASGDG
nr:hypothetical protein [Marinicella sp. W31]MDC2876557.1 hypothetical protein [Marinicella sp. W31]